MEASAQAYLVKRLEKVEEENASLRIKLSEAQKENFELKHKVADHEDTEIRMMRDQKTLLAKCKCSMPGKRISDIKEFEGEKQPNKEKKQAEVVYLCSDEENEENVLSENIITLSNMTKKPSGSTKINSLGNKLSSPSTNIDDNNTNVLNDAKEKSDNEIHSDELLLQSPNDRDKINTITKKSKLFTRDEEVEKPPFMVKMEYFENTLTKENSIEYRNTEVDKNVNSEEKDKMKENKNNAFKCEYRKCDKSFARRQALALHTRSRHRHVKSSCPVCGIEISSSMKRHMSRVHKDQQAVEIELTGEQELKSINYENEKLNNSQSSDNQNLLQETLDAKIKTNLATIEETQIPIDVGEKESLENIQTTGKNETTIITHNAKSNKKKKTNCALIENVKNPNYDKKLSCPACKISLSNRKCLARHMSEKHKHYTDERYKFVCEEVSCGATYEFPKSLKKHVTIRHKPFEPQDDLDVRTKEESKEEESTQFEVRENYETIHCSIKNCKNSWQKNTKKIRYCVIQHLMTHAKFDKSIKNEIPNFFDNKMCLECKKNFETMKAMKSHLVSRHSVMKKEIRKETSLIFHEIDAHPLEDEKKLSKVRVKEESFSSLKEKCAELL